MHPQRWRGTKSAKDLNFDDIAKALDEAAPGDPTYEEMRLELTRRQVKAQVQLPKIMLGTAIAASVSAVAACVTAILTYMHG